MEIELYSKFNDPLSAIEKLGGFLAMSGMFGCTKKEQGYVLAMVCLAEKKSPVEILRTYHIVDGNLSKKALAALAEFNALGGKHKWVESGDAPNPDETKHRASLQLTLNSESITYTYSMADAKQEGLLRKDSRWTKRPGNMLRARCISNGVGMLCPGIFAGADEENEHGPAPVIDLGATRKDPAPAATDIKAEVVSEPVPAPNPDEKVEAAMGLAPEQPKPTSNEDLASKLEQAIGAEYAVEAIKWLTSQNPPWLAPGQQLGEMNEERANKILKKPVEFRRAICQHTPAENGLTCTRCGKTLPQGGLAK